jgi:phospholipid-transporting ATPase
VVQEIQKYNIPDYRPHQEWFKKAVEKIKKVHNPKRYSLGFAFSQTDRQDELIRRYDTTKRKPKGL